MSVDRLEDQQSDDDLTSGWPAVRASELPRSRLRVTALLGEVASGLTARPGRSVLTALGTVLGVGTLVAILGLTATAQGQVSQRFDVLRAVEVRVEQVSEKAAVVSPGEAYNAFPDDAEQRIEALNGVVSAGVWWPVSLSHGQRGVNSLPPGVASSLTQREEIGVYAATPDLLTTVRPSWLVGRGFDQFCYQRSEDVMVLGAAAARRLGIERLDAHPAVFIDSKAFTVIGIIKDVQRSSELLSAAIIPATAAEHYWPHPKEITPQMLIETALGAAQQVASQVPLALRPDAPDFFQVIAPPDPHSLSDNVTSDLASLFLLLAAVSLLIGTFGIANTTLVSVLERTSEIGLRRALGAKPSHIATQFLTESAVLGTLGGLVGTTTGILIVLGVAVSQHWTAIMPQWLLAASLIGTTTGLLAGVYPARKATGIEVVDALRS